MLRPYVKRSRFIVRTNHRSLKWIHDLKISTGCLPQWRLRLMELDFEVQHRPGRKHMAADALPRLSTNRTDNSDFDEASPAYAFIDHYNETNQFDTEKQKSLKIQQFVAAQKNDPPVATYLRKPRRLTVYSNTTSSASCHDKHDWTNQ